jgi:hypothetical protein
LPICFNKFATRHDMNLIDGFYFDSSQIVCNSR